MNAPKPDCEFCSNGYALSAQCDGCLVCARRFGDALGPKFAGGQAAEPPARVPCSRVPSSAPKPARHVRFAKKQQEAWLRQVHAQMNGDELSAEEIIRRMDQIAGLELSHHATGLPALLIRRSVGELFTRSRKFRCACTYRAL